MLVHLGHAEQKDRQTSEQSEYIPDAHVLPPARDNLPNTIISPISRIIAIRNKIGPETGS